MQSTTADLSREQEVERPYLKVQLTLQRAAFLPMELTQEAISVASDRITPIPNMPSHVLGLLNQRSHVFWAINLAQMLGLSHQAFTLQRYSLVIIRSNGIPLGLVIPEVKGVARINPEEIESPIGAIAPGLVPYLRGCYRQGQELIWVLDPEAIIFSTATNAA